MMTQQSYYGAGGEHDPFHRATQHRSLSSGAYYERPAPYAYYNDQSRQDLRAEYQGRTAVRTIIQEPEPENAYGIARRRIAEAVRPPSQDHVVWADRNCSVHVVEDARSSAAVTQAITLAVKLAERQGLILRLARSTESVYPHRNTHLCTDDGCRFIASRFSSCLHKQA